MPGRIAVIGSGIAGLSAAWLLSKSAEVTLIENAQRLGGHSNTVTVSTPTGTVGVDTGFIVYNEQNYPNLTAFFRHLGVATVQSDMSFAVTADNGRMEYSGENLAGLFGQRRNLMRPRHWQMVLDILRFFSSAEAHAATLSEEIGIGEFLRRFGYSQAFIEDHILPISSAIWSTPARSMLDFPARAFVSFFANHGLLKATKDRPRWRTVAGGSQAYVARVTSDSEMRVLVGAHIAAVVRDSAGVDLLFATGEHRRFDQVVFACHPDQALQLIADPSLDERRLLSAVRFTPNRAVLHTDVSLMPKRRHLWSAWNYSRLGGGIDAQLSVTYWMNRLQPLDTATDLFVTLNPARDIAPDAVRYVADYDHPLLDRVAVGAQRQMHRIQGVNRSWFAGAWLGWGFHEDGLQSGLEVAERLGPHCRPWSVPRARDRVAHGWDEEALEWAAE